MAMIEEKAKDVILQKGVDVEIAGRKYHAASPTIATLIEVSALSANLPSYSLDKENVASECIAVADKMAPLGDIVSVLILGAKRRYNIIHRIRRRLLASRILHSMSASELNAVCVELLGEMDLSDFFAITTFLTSTNLLRQTREVVNETTASGQ